MRQVCFWIGVFTWMVPGGTNAVRAEPTGSERPNVVLILSDDQTFTDFGFMGHKVLRTPHIDRLAEASARYVQGYVPSSVCRPSLATLLTGLYPHQHGIHFNHPPPGNGALNKLPSTEYYAVRGRAEQLIRDVPALPRLLAAAGYDCLQTGKYWEGHYNTGGFTHGMTTGHAADHDGCWDKQLPDGITVAHGNGDIGLIIGRETMEPIQAFLDAHDEPDDAPFFLWYAPVMPHEPHNAPKRFRQYYADRDDVPANYVDYYASCTWFDHTVGQLMEMLDAKGFIENTLFVFVVDNGWTPSTTPQPSNPGFRVNDRSKRSPLEDGLRTPILVCWDGHVEAQTIETPINSIDIVPTILHAVGLGDQAADMPGINLLPSASGRTPLQPRPIFGEVYPGDASQLGAPEADVAYRWVRDGDWKLITAHRHGQATPWGGYLNEDAIFHLASDPGEENNCIDDPACAERVTRMRALLDDWWSVAP